MKHIGAGIALFTSLIQLPAYAKMIVGAQYSLFQYTSKSVDEMNVRLGNSPALSMKNQYGKATGFAANAMFPLGTSHFTLETTVSRFAESFAGEAETVGGPEIESQFAGYQLFVGIGGKFWPRPERHSRNSRGRTPPKSSGGFKERTYAFAFVGSGVFVGQHNFSLSYPRKKMEIEYSTNAIHTANGALLRLGINTIPNLDLVCDVSYHVTSKFRSTHNLSAFWLEDQDQRHNKKAAKLSKVTDSPFTVWRASIGLAFTP